MRQIKALRTISFIGFVLFTFGCAKSKSHQSVNIGLKAETVPEGICITFDNIPPETSRMFIGIQKGLEHSPPANPYNIIFNYSDLTDDSLEHVKKTGRIIFPVVQNGERYRVDVSLQKEGYKPIEGIPEWINAECTAGNGIYFDRNIELKLDEAHTTAMLSSEPIFSSELNFDADKYSYNITIIQKHTETDVQSISFGDNHIANGLRWGFEPELTNSLNKENTLKKGSYPAYVTAHCNIIYDNIKWFVEIAKTPEFTYGNL